MLGRGLIGIGPFIAGFVVGDLIWLLLAAFGFAAPAHEFAGAMLIVRWLGAFYLLRLAWVFWHAPPAALSEDAAPDGRRAFLTSLSLTLGNPEVIVFFLSIMPLVVDLDAMGPESFVTPVGLSALILPTVLIAYAFAAARARRLFRSQRAMRALNRGAAGMMTAVAVAVVTR